MTRQTTPRRGDIANDLKALALFAFLVANVGVIWVLGCIFVSAIGYDLKAIAMRIATNSDDVPPVWTYAREHGLALAKTHAWVPFAGALVWFASALVSYGQRVRASAGARPASRVTEPHLFDAVEDLAKRAGVPTPRIDIIETDALNAYASGLTASDAVIGVTRGLLDMLDPEELRAVLAHEMTHIQRADVRLMSVVSVLGGLLRFGSATLGNGVPSGHAHRVAVQSAGPAGAILFGALKAAGMLMSAVGVLCRCAISQTREFAADAGAAELTGSVEPLIIALKKIARHDEIPGLPDGLQAMMISSHLERMITTHPSIQSRITALRRLSITPRAGADAPRAAPDATAQAPRVSFNDTPRRTFGRRAPVQPKLEV